MTWTDLMLDRVVDDDLLADGFARVFEVDAGAIPIVATVSGGAAAGLADAPLWIERSRIEGDFPLRLSVSIRDDLRPLVEEPAGEQAVIARLCAFWRCSCLFNDDALNPYTWLVMRPNGRLEAVTVDAERLDEADAFVIARVDRVIRRVPVAV